MKPDSSIRILVGAVRDYYKSMTRTEIFATILVLVGVLNFVMYMAFCMNIGGSAGNGDIHDEKYFVSEHGNRSEVTSRTFRMNQIHGRSLWITHPMAFLGLLIFAASSSKVYHAKHLR